MLKKLLTTLTVSAGLVGLLGNGFAQSNQEPSLLPQGTIAFESDRDGVENIYSIKTDGSELTKLTEDETRDVYPRWSPDGSKIAFVSTDDQILNIYVMNRDGSDAYAVTNSEEGVYSPAWSPDGTEIAYINHGTEIRIVNVDGTGDRLFLTGENYLGLDWSKQGRIITGVRSTENPNLFNFYSIGYDGQNPITLYFDTFAISPSWHSEGEKVIFSARINSKDRSNFEICEAYEDGSGVSTLTNNPVPDLAPRWSPEGDYFVFTSISKSENVETVSDVNLDIYISTPNETNVIRLTTHEGEDRNPDWTNN